MFEPPSKESLAAGFAFARHLRDPRFRAYVTEITGTTGGEFVIVDPDESASQLFIRLAAADMPVIAVMADESQPFGHQILVVSGPDVSMVAGWRSTLAIHDDPELHAILTAPVDEDELPDEAPVLAAAARRPHRFRRT